MSNGERGYAWRAERDAIIDEQRARIRVAVQTRGTVGMRKDTKMLD